MISYIKKIFKSITGQEIKFVFIASGVVMLISLIPFIYANLIAKSEMQYTGFTWVAGFDKMLYLSQIEQARQGKFLLSNLYNTDFGSFAIFSPLRLAEGWLGKITGLPNLTVFHAVRIFFGFGFCFLFYLFISRIFAEIKWRKICLGILVASSGLGVFTIYTLRNIQSIGDNAGIDLWVSESNTFLNLSHSALFTLSQLIILLVFWWFIARFKKAGLIEVLGLSLIILFLGFIHPFDLIIISAVLSVYSLFMLVKKFFHFNELIKLLLIFAVSFQSIVYFLWLKSNNPAFYQWTRQNICSSPRLLNFLIGFGLILVFYLIGLWLNRKNKNRYTQFLIIWSVVGWLIIYLPFDFNRRLVNGLHIPLVIIGTFGIKWFWEKLKLLKNKLAQVFIINILIVFLIVTNLCVIGLELVVLSKTQKTPFFIHEQELKSINWLKENFNDDQIILSGSISGSLIPAFSGHRVYLSFPYQTNYGDIKILLVEKWFFANNIYDEQKTKWLKSQKIDLIYYGAYERTLGNFNPFSKDYIQPIFINGQTAIFKVL